MRNELNASTLIGCVVGWLLLASVANAQTLGEGISVTGAAESVAPADFMRLGMTIEAQGATFEDAIELLAKKRKKATIKLEKLLAVEDSIEFGDVTAGQAGGSPARMQQVRQMMGNDPRMAKMMEAKPPVKLTLSVTADWKLDTEADPDDQLVETDKLKQKISDADVGGVKDENELSEEQQELAEEMAAMVQQYTGSQGPKAGAPEFRYGRQVPAAKYDQLVGEAFADAKGKAERLASATGFELGTPRSIVDSSAQMSQALQYQMSYGYGGRSEAVKTKTLEDGGKEVFGTSPNKITVTARVAVVYAIKE